MKHYLAGRYLAVELVHALVPALRVEVPEDVRHVGVRGDLLVGLEGGGEGGLALLAPHQVGAEQVHDDDVPVQRLKLPKVSVKSWGR